MTDMIERAVRAMCDVMGEPPCDYPACGCGAAALLVRQARAAIEAMREPSAESNTSALFRKGMGW